MTLVALTGPDYARATRVLSRRDPVLRDLIREHGPCGIPDAPRRDHFHALTQAIVSQQLSTRAAATIYGRVLALFGGELPTPESLLAASDEALRGAGLSRGKVSFLRDLAARVIDGRLDLSTLETLDDEAVIDRLTQVKGVGRWTAEMLLIFRLHRPDVLPIADQGIVRAMQRAYALRTPPKPARMVRLAEPWRPYRSVACWYLWASLDNVPQPATPGKRTS